jgi:excisionase family DNA binding protein
MVNMTITQRLLTTSETMQYLSIGKTKLFKMVKEGRLNPVRIDSNLRFDKEDLDEFISRSKDKKAQK